MKIQIQPQEDHQVEITAEFEAGSLDRYMRQGARKISEEAKIPGFRPGKAPYDVVKRYYGQDMIEKQAIEIMLDDVYPDVLKEAQVESYGPGSLKDIPTNNPPTFVFMVPLAPVVDTGDYSAIRLHYESVVVSEDEVNEVIHTLRLRYATAEPVERPVKDGDKVNITLNAVLPEEENREILTKSPLQVVVGDLASKKNEWPYEGFSYEIIGLSAGDSKEIHYRYAPDSQFEALRDKEVVFNVIIDSVKQLQLPDLNDEFAKSIAESGFDTYEAMVKQVRSQIESRKKEEYDQKYSSELMGKIVDQASVKYPPQVIEEEIGHLLESLEHDLSHQNLEMDTYLKSRQITREALIKNELEPVAKTRIKRALVMQEVSRKENIEIDPKELQEAVLDTLMQLSGQPGFKMPSNDARMRELTDAVSYDTANRLLSEKLVSRIIEIGSGKAASVSESSEEAADEIAVEKTEKKSKKKKAE